MPSEPPRSGRLAPALRSQGLGLICAALTVLLLAVGSVCLAATRDGASAGVHLDDLRAFFQRPSPWHLWLYLLIPVLLLYALNTVLCTWRSLTRLLRSGVRSPSAYGPTVMHLGFLVALAAHAVGGLLGGEDRPVVVGSTVVDLGGGWTGRLESLQVERLPGGMPRQVHARLALTDPAGRASRQVVGFNRPASAGFGARLWLLSRFDQQLVATLTDGDSRCMAPARETCRLGDRAFHVLGLLPGGHGDGVPAAALMTVGQGRHQRLLVKRGQPAAHPGGAVTLLALDRQPVVLLRARRAPGNPVALAAVVIFALGMLLMGRRWFQG